MDFSFNEEQLELRKSRADVPRRDSFRVGCQFGAVHGQRTRLRPGNSGSRLGSELGWTAVAIPEEYGGLGLGYVELVRPARGDGRIAPLRPLLFERLPWRRTRSSTAAGADAPETRSAAAGIAEGETHRATLALQRSRRVAGMPSRSKPPFRRDSENGFVSAERYEALRSRRSLSPIFWWWCPPRRQLGRGRHRAFCRPRREHQDFPSRRLPTMDQSVRQAEIEL